MKKQKIVTIGGGTGSFVVLSGLKNYDVDLTAVVSMADDGGSTGILRDELGVLPPGDIRQCLVALSKSSEVLREMFNYRYSQGALHGHNFGNIFLSTLEKITGNFTEAVKQAGQILRIKGKVLPVTLKSTKLVAELNSGKKIVGENRINESDLSNLKKLFLAPGAKINPEVAKALKEADKIIINPGNFFCSIVPNFLVSGLGEAIAKSKAKKILIVNLMTKRGHTDKFCITDFAKYIENFIGKNIINYTIYNTQSPDVKVLKNYSREGDILIKLGDKSTFPRMKFIGRNLLGKLKYKQSKSDVIKRSFIRHDSDKLAKIIYNL